MTAKAITTNEKIEHFKGFIVLSTVLVEDYTKGVLRNIPDSFRYIR